MNAAQGGFAFPLIGDFGVESRGMTLRDYFAAQVLLNHPFNAHEKSEIARYAYDIADAMIAERNKR